MSSSHREAPLIANDPQADNTDLYAFKSPFNENKVVIIANYIPGELPYGGPNYYTFASDVRYEVHIDNNIATPGDDIIYRFTFSSVNEDPTTFFNIRLGKQNIKTTYTCEKSINGGVSFTTIITNGSVPPTNIGPRSIGGPVGLNTDYDLLWDAAVTTASSGERIVCGPVDDPFFVDLGGIFDVGDAPRQTSGASRDGLGHYNVHAICIEADISSLQKDGKVLSKATDILDPNYVIGVWASASRQRTKVLNTGGSSTLSGKWVQVSRLGMPLANEVVVPIGYKDYWNSLTPYQDLTYLSTFGNFFYNPELALYMDDAQFGGAVPAFSQLRIQKNSLSTYGFGNGQDGLYPLKGTPALDGTALAESAFGGLLLPAAASPRSVDLWPAFNTGVPNLRPYQLATGKNGDPLATGKPFINNFLPNGGDMLRLNMAVPVTPRNSPDFSSDGLIQAAVLGLTDARYNTTTDLQFIPNMDGFPNGRRLEDDVTRIELQAVGGVVLAAIGLPYDDYVSGGSLVTQDLVDVLSYVTGINNNDTSFRPKFPYVQTPWAGTSSCCGILAAKPGGKPMIVSTAPQVSGNIGISTPQVFATASPNPFVNSVTVKYHVQTTSNVGIAVYDAQGKLIKVLVNAKQTPGTYSVQWNASSSAAGVYYINTAVGGDGKQTIKVVKQ